MVAPVFENTEDIKIHVRCFECNKFITLVVKAKDWERYKRGESYVQDIFPYLSADERELLISQICGSCYDKMFPPE